MKQNIESREIITAEEKKKNIINPRSICVCNERTRVTVIEAVLGAVGWLAQNAFRPSGSVQRLESQNPPFLTLPEASDVI